MRLRHAQTSTGTHQSPQQIAIGLTTDPRFCETQTRPQGLAQAVVVGSLAGSPPRWRHLAGPVYPATFLAPARFLSRTIARSDNVRYVN
jgi:hypothetical protein